MPASEDTQPARKLTLAIGRKCAGCGRLNDRARQEQSFISGICAVDETTCGSISLQGLNHTVPS